MSNKLEFTTLRDFITELESAALRVGDDAAVTIHGYSGVEIGEGTEDISLVGFVCKKRSDV